MQNDQLCQQQQVSRLTISSFSLNKSTTIFEGGNPDMSRKDNVREDYALILKKDSIIQYKKIKDTNVSSWLLLAKIIIFLATVIEDEPHGSKPQSKCSGTHYKI